MEKYDKKVGILAMIAMMNTQFENQFEVLFGAII